MRPDNKPAPVGTERQAESKINVKVLNTKPLEQERRTRR